MPNMKLREMGSNEITFAQDTLTAKQTRIQRTAK